MSKKFRVLDYDIVYLSYDEPNAEQNYADLCTKIPWAKRVHGVEGSDSAHKACAELSETDRFVTIDGDNRIREHFLTQEINFEEHVELENKVISWCGHNVINGLMYGNGGVKCWPKDFVLGMRTHENADADNPHAQVDFCWDVEYIQMNSCFSDIYNNHTPHQAWRAGFREGVKMALDQGVKPTLEEFRNNHWKNLHRLYIWLMIGNDIQNGNWAIMGAREGLYKTMCSKWDYVQVRDFTYLNKLWDEDYSSMDDVDCNKRLVETGQALITDMELPIAPEPLDKEQSKFFKTVYLNPARISHAVIDPE